MSTAISLFLIISIILITTKFLKAKNFYEKILGFYFIFTNAIILILVNSTTDFENILDITIILFLLQMTIILFLFSNQKKI